MIFTTLSCKKESLTIDKDIKSSNAFWTGKCIGDSLNYVNLNEVFELLNSPMINDSVKKDTFKLDLNHNGINDLMIVYTGMYNKYGYYERPTKPNIESLRLIINDNLQVIEGVKYNSYYLGTTFSYGDTIDNKTNWIWQNEIVIISRQLNSGLQSFKNDSNIYFPYKRIYQNSFGWIKFELIRSDIYFDKLKIVGYCEIKK
jgi:hypothetical protein